ncbi:hypothetical protein [Nostoc sp.]|uniref:hypothetical protein n=1 Tax=Nostoc sp. TaxID=1180 RepID=UPI002FF9DDB1
MLTQKLRSHADRTLAFLLAAIAQNIFCLKSKKAIAHFLSKVPSSRWFLLNLVAHRVVGNRQTIRKKLE